MEESSMLGYFVAFSSINNTSAKEICVSVHLALYVLVSDRVALKILSYGKAGKWTCRGEYIQYVHEMREKLFACSSCLVMYKYR